MPRCWPPASTAPAAASASARARPLRSIAAASTRRRKRAISSRCSDTLHPAGRDRAIAEGGVAEGQPGGAPSGQRRERRLEAKDVEAIFREFAKVMQELPPDTEAGWLDAQGDLRLAPDIGRKLRTARGVRDLLRQIRLEQEGREPTD